MFGVDLVFSATIFELLFPTPGRRFSVSGVAVSAVGKEMLVRTAFSPPKAATAFVGSSGLRNTPGNSMTEKDLRSSILPKSETR